MEEEEDRSTASQSIRQSSHPPLVRPVDRSVVCGPAGLPVRLLLLLPVCLECGEGGQCGQAVPGPDGLLLPPDPEQRHGHRLSHPPRDHSQQPPRDEHHKHQSINQRSAVCPQPAYLRPLGLLEGPGQQRLLQLQLAQLEPLLHTGHHHQHHHQHPASRSCCCQGMDACPRCLLPTCASLSSDLGLVLLAGAGLQSCARKTLRWPPPRVDEMRNRPRDTHDPDTDQPTNNKTTRGRLRRTAAATCMPACLPVTYLAPPPRAALSGRPPAPPPPAPPGPRWETGCRHHTHHTTHRTTVCSVVSLPATASFSLLYV